jgi:ribosomal protein S18 acetylase RimI-like enzyme
VIRRLTPGDAGEAERVVNAVLGSRHQARLDEVIDVLACPGLGMWKDGRLVGLATYVIDGEAAEIAALGVLEEYRGRRIAAALVEATMAEIARAGVRRVWVVTTNDNLTALATYQRHGFRLVELRPGAVDRARAAKPSIPVVGRHGIPMRDELVLERLSR